MNADEVVSYLQAHPDFLVEHSELFTEITVPHPHRGQAISLAERQLHALRDKIRLLESKLVELISFGEENDEISTKVHRLCLALLEAGDYESLRYALLESLREDFAVPHIAFRIWNSVLSREHEDFTAVSEDLRFHAGDLPQPYCGAPDQLEILNWFGEASPMIRSIALIPLQRDQQICGLLALGSEDDERFYPGMGTLYLTRIGELFAAALRHHLG